MALASDTESRTSRGQPCVACSRGVPFLKSTDLPVRIGSGGVQTSLDRTLFAWNLDFWKLFKLDIESAPAELLSLSRSDRIQFSFPWSCDSDTFKLETDLLLEKMFFFFRYCIAWALVAAMYSCSYISC